MARRRLNMIAWCVALFVLATLLSNVLMRSAAPRVARLEEEKARLSAALAAAQELLDGQKRRRAFEDRTEIRVAGAADAFSRPFRMIQGKAIEEQTFYAFLPRLIDELELYPPALFGAAGIKRIVICGALETGGRAVGGLADTWGGFLYVTVPNSDSEWQWCRSALHHELFHFIDARWGREEDDPDWMQLNPTGFSYLASAYEALDRGGYDGPDRPRSPGFISAYAEATAGEDKAELFSSLMIEPRTVEQLIAGDPVLKAKVELMKARLLRIVPPLDDVFWQMVLAYRQHSGAAAQRAP